MDFKKVSDLEQYLIKQIAATLDTNVAPVVKKEESKQMKKYYSEFEPFKYNRRKDNGGMSDVGNMNHNIQVDNNNINMIIHNDTKTTDGHNGLAEIIETGVGYTYPYGHNVIYFLKPRTVVGNTLSEILKNKEHIKALRSGLKNKGLRLEFS